jgi:hypothetical protein
MAQHRSNGKKENKNNRNRYLFVNKRNEKFIPANPINPLNPGQKWMDPHRSSGGRKKNHDLPDLDLLQTVLRISQLPEASCQQLLCSAGNPFTLSI